MGVKLGMLVQAYQTKNLYTQSDVNRIIKNISSSFGLKGWSTPGLKGQSVAADLDSYAIRT